MSFRFHKRIRIAKGLYVNVTQSGVTSMSAKAGPLTVNKSFQTGTTRLTASAAGTGLSYSTALGRKAIAPLSQSVPQPAAYHQQAAATPMANSPSPSKGVIWAVGFGLGILGALFSGNVAVGMFVSAGAIAVLTALSKRR